MMKAFVVETREDYPRGKAGEKKVFFSEGVIHNDAMRSMPVEMPEPGLPFTGSAVG